MQPYPGGMDGKYTTRFCQREGSPWCNTHTSSTEVAKSLRPAHRRSSLSISLSPFLLSLSRARSPKLQVQVQQVQHKCGQPKPPRYVPAKCSSLTPTTSPWRCVRLLPALLPAPLIPPPLLWSSNCSNSASVNSCSVRSRSSKAGGGGNQNREEGECQRSEKKRNLLVLRRHGHPSHCTSKAFRASEQLTCETLG